MIEGSSDAATCPRRTPTGCGGGGGGGGGGRGESGGNWDAAGTDNEDTNTFRRRPNGQRSRLSDLVRAAAAARTTQQPQYL